MQYLELAPPPPLRRVVHCFWFLRGDFRDPDPEPIVPDGRVDIILHLAEAFSRLDEQGHARREAGALISGQLTSPIRLVGNGIGDVVGIRFRTAAAGVLGLPLTEMTDRVVALRDLAPGLARKLAAAAGSVSASADRVQALTRVLLRAVGERPLPDPVAAAAVRGFELATPTRIGALADRLGVSARTLDRRVAGATGLQPAMLRRLVRFRRAFRLLNAAPTGSGAAVAARAGYFDQAHLIRDFRRFAGTAPTDFFRTEPEFARAMLGTGTGD